MAGATFGTIQTRVQKRLRDLPSDTVAEIPNLINLAMGYVQRKHNFVVMEQTMVVTTTIGQRVLNSIPTNFKELRPGNCWYVDLNGEPVKVFFRSTLEAVLAQFAYDDPTETGAPMVLLQVPTGSAAEGANEGPPAQIQVWPYPDGQSQWGTGSVTTLKDPLGNTVTVPSGEYPIFIPYWGYVPQLVAQGDQNWFTDNAEDFLVFAALAEAFYMNWDEQRGAMWAARAFGPQYEAQGIIGGRMREVISLDKRRRVAKTNTLMAFRDAFGPTKRLFDGFTQVPGF